MLNGAVLTLGFVNRVEVYSLLGAVESKVSFTSLGSQVQLKTSQDFGGEVGIRANTPIWGDMKFGVDAKYFYAWPTLSQIKVEGVAVPSVGKVFQKEWQIGGAVSQNFAYFTPYVGVKFSKFSMECVDLSSLQSLGFSEVNIHNEGPFGFFVGMGVAGEKGVYFDFEARFMDEYALTAALGVSF